MLLKSVRALLQFTTILPMGETEDFGWFAKRSWLYPVAGYITGGIAAIFAFFIGPPILASGIALATLLIISGANHFDGLLDLGDGLMAHGSREKRIQALTDRQTGTGGIALAIGITLIAFAGLAGSAVLWASIIAAEVCAKFSMAFLTAYGTPFHEGIHSYLYTSARPWFPAASAVLCLPVIFLPLSPVRLAGAAAAMIITPLILFFLARRTFGGVNGDVVGASSEITRAMVLLVLAIVPAWASF